MLNFTHACTNNKSIIVTHLNSGLRQRRPCRELLPRLEVRVVTLFKLLLEVLQLLGRERCPAPAELRPVVVRVATGLGPPVIV
jgi:hypothetical protein